MVSLQYVVCGISPGCYDVSVSLKIVCTTRYVIAHIYVQHTHHPLTQPGHINVFFKI